MDYGAWATNVQYTLIEKNHLDIGKRRGTSDDAVNQANRRTHQGLLYKKKTSLAHNLP